MAFAPGSEVAHTPMMATINPPRRAAERWMIFLLFQNGPFPDFSVYHLISGRRDISPYNVTSDPPFSSDLPGFSQTQALICLLVLLVCRPAITALTLLLIFPVVLLLRLHPF